MAYSALMADDLLDGIDSFLDDSIVLPPGDWDENLLLPVMHERNEMRKRKASKMIEHERRELFAVDPLQHSRRLCGGIWTDIKKLARRYPSDIRDMFHFQTFISLIFLYVAFLAPAVAFGGLMEEVTGNLIGETETLVMTGLSGILYGLAACQPLTILAFTGPLLLFEEVVFAFSQQFDIPYLEWRAVIGIWLMFLLTIAAVSEITFLVTRFSRFSEEIFTGIIAIFFTYEATKSIIGVFKRNPLCSLDYPCTSYDNSCQPLYNSSNSTTTCSFPAGGGLSSTLPSGFRVCNQPNTALWSMILCLCTFFITLLLSKLRKGKFLGKRLRRTFSDFSMFVALFAMVVIAYLFRDKIAVETLVVPADFQPSCSSRSALAWIIDPFTSGRMETWMYFAAIIPAGLLATLIFVENQLACILVNKAEHKLQKEVGYHYDLLLVALLNGLGGVMGMPWVCSASVRSVQHVQSMGVFKAHNAPGEKPKLLRVYEQRMTNVVVHLFILLTPLAYKGLRLIPIPVVLGVFLYLTYSSLSGVQLTKRIKLLFIPPKHHPDIFYVRKVRTIRMHMYTIIQVRPTPHDLLTYLLMYSVWSHLHSYFRPGTCPEPNS
jgi:anion exchange protein